MLSNFKPPKPSEPTKSIVVKVSGVSTKHIFLVLHVVQNDDVELVRLMKRRCRSQEDDANAMSPAVPGSQYLNNSMKKILLKRVLNLETNGNCLP